MAGPEIREGQGYPPEAFSLEDLQKSLKEAEAAGDPARVAELQKEIDRLQAAETAPEVPEVKEE